MTHGWLRGLVAASCLSVVLAALAPGTGLDALVGSPSIAQAASAPGADGRVVDPGDSLEVGTVAPQLQDRSTTTRRWMV